MLSRFARLSSAKQPEFPPAVADVMSTDVRSAQRGSPFLVRFPFLRLACCLLSLGLFYLLMFDKYRAYDIDNPWFLSFSYNLWHHNIATDTFRLGVFPNGMGGTVVFGKLVALSQGLLLSHVGWYPFPAFLAVLAAVMAAYAAWWAFLETAGRSSSFRTVFLLVIGVLEPFVSMAEKDRYEYFSWLLLALALLLASRGAVFFALVVAFLAAETQPIALIVPVIVLLYVGITAGWTRGLAWKGVSALAMFAAFYLSLHPDVPDILRQTQWHSASNLKVAGGFLYAYFVQRRRHLPELLIVFAIAVGAWRGRLTLTRFGRFSAAAALVVAFSGFATRWPTVSYMVFFFPFAVALGLELWPPERHGRLAVAIILGLVIPQYGYLYWVNRDEGYTAADIQAVSSALQTLEDRLALKPGDARIYGDQSLWYAHPEHYLAASKALWPDRTNADIVLCYDAPLLPISMTDPSSFYCPEIRRRIDLKEAQEIRIRGHALHLLLRSDASAAER